MMLETQAKRGRGGVVVRCGAVLTFSLALCEFLTVAVVDAGR